MVHLRCAVSETLPFADASFDVVTLLAVFEHLQEKERVVSEIFRVLKTPGLVILTVPHPAVDHILKIWAACRLVEGMALDQHHHFDSRATRRLFEQRGFALKRWSRFQLGLNNLFIFEKAESPAACPTPPL